MISTKKDRAGLLFKNILTGVNDVVEDADNPGTQITRFTDGYWTFRDIQSEFKSKSIDLRSNMYNGKCSLKSTKALKMGKLGTLLGFAEDHVFVKNDWNHSTSDVNINHGLKYLKINVDAIVPNESYDEKGRRSENMTFLTIDTGRRLFGEKTDFHNINETVMINPEFNSLKFTVTSNIDDLPVNVEVLLDMEIL